VTTEDDFQTALDANPNDWQTRAVLSDFLEDRGDPRAAGYRALAARQWRPYLPPNNVRWTIANYRVAGQDDVSDLPDDWFALVWEAVPKRDRTRSSKGLWVAVESRREAEDVAARAFAALPPDRQRELLAAPAAAPAKKPRRRNA
jgi:uncharacterized protein (TIGR02996 family)